MGNNWQLDLTGTDELFNKMERMPDQSESIINNTLRTKGGKIIQSIMPGLIPLSPIRGKSHARNSNPYSVTKINLGLKIRPKKKFEYIKYPDLGIGTNHKNKPKEFMLRGLEKSASPITDELIAEFDKNIL